MIAEKTDEQWYKEYLGGVLDFGKTAGNYWLRDRFSAPIAPNEHGTASNTAGVGSDTVHKQPKYWGSMGDFGIAQNALIIGGAVISIILLVKLAK